MSVVNGGVKERSGIEGEKRDGHLFMKDGSTKLIWTGAYIASSKKPRSFTCRHAPLADAQKLLVARGKVALAECRRAVLPCFVNPCTKKYNNHD
jgi:hypothetical protein